jgi:hypothetical protein
VESVFNLAKRYTVVALLDKSVEKRIDYTEGVVEPQLVITASTLTPPPQAQDVGFLGSPRCTMNLLTGESVRLLMLPKYALETVPSPSDLSGFTFGSGRFPIVRLRCCTGCHLRFSYPR